MTLEATMIVIDNSDWSRNGDFFPNRWTAQHDSANLLAETKCSLNPESSVGLMTMAGKQVDVLVTPISDPGKILTSLHGVKLGGRTHLINALQVAQLALKHRMNKNQRQRIVVFVASPLEEDEKTLVALGKKFKKNNVALDVINLEVTNDEQNKKLRAMVEAADNSDNSHFVEAQTGMQMLSDALITTPIYQGAEGSGMGGGLGGFEGGAQMDPELEMAIRISLEEEKERNARKEDEKKKEGGASTDQNKMQEEAPASQAQDNKMVIEGGNATIEDEDEEELMRRARELSLQEAPKENNAAAPQQATEASFFNDPSFVQDLLKDLDLDQSDPQIKEALENAQKKDKEKKDEEKK